ncbi:MAG TPA: hypothetical protein VHP33_04315 [Polyangiaceae bacterium]|nr:hypothetical protein [Polyangiaceae bacterium]
MRWILSLALASCVLAQSGAASAAEPVPGQAYSLRDEARRARTWRYVWSGVNAGLMVGSFAAVPLVEREARPDWIISGIGSGITVAATWLWPLRVESASEELDALPDAERAKQWRRLRTESAEDERARVTWPWHVINFGLCAGTGAIIAFGYDHYWSGLITTVGGTALGEVQLFTQPTGLVKAGAEAASFSLVPRLAFTPGRPAAPATWTLSVASAF